MPSRPPHPCPTCGTLTTNRHCPPCTTNRHRRRETRRGNRHQRGYNAQHQRNRKTLLADHPPCHWCGEPATVADHLVPLSRGGSNDIANLVASCVPCNSRRITR